jgi:hypothetical protein
MMDAETLEAILDEYEPGTHTELLALCAAKARLREGADPTVVLAVMEGSRDMAAFEREHGVRAVFDGVNAEALIAQAHDQG